MKMKNKQFGYSFGISVIFSSFSSFKLLCQKIENKWKGSSNCVWRHRPIWFPGNILRQALRDGRLVDRKKMCGRGLIEVEEFPCSSAVSYFWGLQPRNYFYCRIAGRCSVLQTGELLIVVNTTIRTILGKNFASSVLKNNFWFEQLLNEAIRQIFQTNQRIETKWQFLRHLTKIDSG